MTQCSPWTIREIARRHVTAYLFQRVPPARLPTSTPRTSLNCSKCSAPSTGFLGTTSPLNRDDFEAWLREHETDLVRRCPGLATRRTGQPGARPPPRALVDDTLQAARRRCDGGSVPHMRPDESLPGKDDEDATVVDVPGRGGRGARHARPCAENLLDRLLYKGVLPRYAFPTDVVSFYVFDRERSTRVPAGIPLRPESGPADCADAVRAGEGGVDRRQAVAIRRPVLADVRRPDPGLAERRALLRVRGLPLREHRDVRRGERGEIRDCPACGSETPSVRRELDAPAWLRPPAQLGGGHLAR